MSAPVWFITGVSSGLGLQLALVALEQGHTVVGSVRNTEVSADAVAAVTAQGGHIVELDMRQSPDEIARVVKKVEADFGRIDFLANNAGYATMGPVETVSPGTLLSQFLTNLHGPLFTIQAALPGMRARKSGTIVNLSSAGGFQALPGFSSYAASKFALEGLSESLAQEVSDFGIRVIIVEPGAFRTNFGNAAEKPQTELPEGYAGTTVDLVMKRLMNSSGEQIGNPRKAAARMYQYITGAKEAGHAHRLVMGTDAINLMQAKVHRVSGAIALARDAEQVNSTAF